MAAGQADLTALLAALGKHFRTLRIRDRIRN